MTHQAPLRRMAHGSQFHALGLHADALISPFLGIDHAWISGPTFPPHPHAGFSAVSYLFLDSQTHIDNRDSLGGRHEIQPGGLHWTAAGRGVVHEETPAQPGQTVHMLQIFVNLPADRQHEVPFALRLTPQEVPVVQLPGARVRVPLGAFAGVRSPLNPPTPVQLLDISLEAGAELDLPVEAGHTAFALPIHGELVVGDQPLDAEGGHIPIFAAQAQGHTLRLQALQGPATVAFFAGAPLHQPIHRQGPMAMASAEALAAAIAAYRRGDLGTL
ncbi:MAG: hypothetical protein RLZZ182_2386 [Pseudomonadota bacterium]